MTRYPFRTSYVPGAPRPDLADLVHRHLTRCPPKRRASQHAIALCRETTPEPAGEYGTLIPYPAVERFLQALDDGDRILRNHRRMAHAAWVRAVQQDDDEQAACNAWHCARLHCGKEL